MSQVSKNWRIYRIPKSIQLSMFPLISFFLSSNLCIWYSFTLNRLNLLRCIHPETALFSSHSYPLVCCFSTPHPSLHRILGWSLDQSGYLLSTTTSQFVSPFSIPGKGCVAFSCPLPRPFHFWKSPYPIPACLERSSRIRNNWEFRGQFWHLMTLLLSLWTSIINNSLI